jgi:hypothetical protein
VTKRDLLELRKKACRDRGLSHGAARLFCCLVDHIYIGLLYPDQDEFDLPGSLVETWLHAGRNQALAYRAELIRAKYIRFRRLRGCPPAHVFSFFQCPRKGDNDVPESGTSSSPNRGNHSPRNGDAHTSIPVREEVLRKGGERGTVEKKPVPVGKAKRAWWATPPKFEELDRKTFPRERKALAKEMLEFVVSKMEGLKTEFRLEKSYADWPDQARTTYEAFRDRRDAIKAWVNGVKR